MLHRTEPRRGPYGTVSVGPDFTTAYIHVVFVFRASRRENGGTFIHAMKKSPLQLLQRCEGKFLRNICTRRKALNGDSLVDGGVVLVEDERVGDGDVYKKAENVLVHFPAL